MAELISFIMLPVFLDRCYAVVEIYRVLYIPYSALSGGPKSHTVLQDIYSALLGGSKSHTVLQSIYIRIATGIVHARTATLCSFFENQPCLQKGTT